MDRQLLSRATDNSDAPTPGYMYLDIAKNAASNPATCSEIAKFLTNRLASRQNHNVKYKCLKIISKTCVSPYLKGQFKRSLAQDPNAMTAIKEALQFRGPPDPVRGDEPYERVRVAAKEALDAVYSDTPVDAAPSTSYASVSSSYAPSPHASSGYGPSGAAAGGGGARRMDGIGNPMFSDPRMAGGGGGPGGMGPGGIGNMTIKDVVNEAKDTVIGMIRDPLARNTNVQVQHAGSMPRPGGAYGGPSPYSNPPGRNELMQQTGGQWTMASNRGPAAVAPPPNYANDSAYYKSRENNNAYAWAQKGPGAPGGVGGSWATAAPAPSIASQARQPYEQHHQATPSITVTSTPGAAPAYPSQGGGAVADGSYEKQLIMELCPPGGMKAEPPPDKLNQFCRSVANLNPDLVCPTLLDCLEEGQPWIIRAKALWVIEACIKHGQRPGAASNAYADFFHTCSGEVAPLANHNRAQIRDPAKRVLNLLGVATPAAGTVPVAAAPAAPLGAPAAAPVAAMPNLLDFDEPEPEQPPTPPSAPPPAAPPAPVDTGASLFGGLNVSSPAGAPPSQPPPPPPAAAPSAPPPPPSSGDLLGDFLQDAAPAPAADNSLFGDMAVKESPAPAPASNASVDETASMFGDLMVKSAETPKESAPAPAAGSAFGFINDSAPKKEAPVAPAPPSAASRASFDPLQNMTPNTAQKMMQVSPEQMQAMYYQQMLMQQQMQMAQMMAMQRGGAGGGMMHTPMPGMMQGAGGANRTSMAFRNQPVPREDKQFNFIQDAVSKEKKK